MAIVPTKETIKRRTIADMKELGVYRTQYGRIIDLYSELVFQFLTLNKQFEEEGYQYESYTAAGGAKKAPIVATLESLRKDILAYSNQLCLNPKSLESVTVEDKGKKSTLATILGEMSG